MGYYTSLHCGHGAREIEDVAYCINKAVYTHALNQVPSCCVCVCMCVCVCVVKMFSVCFQVCAISSGGRSEWSPLTVLSTPAVRPSPPLYVYVLGKPTQTSITVQWGKYNNSLF